MIVHESGLTNAGHKIDNVFQGWHNNPDYIGPLKDGRRT